MPRVFQIQSHVISSPNPWMKQGVATWSQHVVMTKRVYSTSPAMRDWKCQRQHQAPSFRKNSRLQSWNLVWKQGMHEVCRIPAIIERSIPSWSAVLQYPPSHPINSCAQCNMVMMLVNIFRKEFHYQLMCTSFRAVMLPQDQLALGTCNLNLFTIVCNIIKNTDGYNILQPG